MRPYWLRVRLGEVLRRSDEAVAVRADTTYLNFGIYSYGRGLFKKPLISGASTSASTLYRARAGQFVYSRLFAFEGAYGFVTHEFDGYYVSNEFPLFDCNLDLVVPAFIAAYITQPRVWRSIAESAVGVGHRRQRVQPEDLLTYWFPLPPLAEQRRIVARIDKLTAKIREASTLRQQAAAAMEIVITSLHSQLAGVRTRQLGEILTLDEDAAEVQPSGVYPQVGVRSFGAGLFPKSPVTGIETTYKKFNRLYEGAVVLSQVKGWEGAVAGCPAELSGWFVSPEYRTLRCVAGEARPGYMAWLVRTEWFWSKLGDATRGVGARRERTRPEQFLEIRLPMPDVKQQERGERLFAELDRLKRLQIESTAELDTLLPAVLDRAFRGEL